MFCKDPGNSFCPCSIIPVRDCRYLLIPELFELSIYRAESVFPDYPPADRSFMVADEQPVTAEIQADLGPAFINRTGCTITMLILPQECAGDFMRTVPVQPPLSKFVGNLFAVRRIHMGKKDRVVDFTAAIIIPVIELALDSDKGAKAHAAFPAPVTFKHCHCR